MADNVAITAGSGTSIAADDITSVFYQRVKLSLGADGTAVDAVAGAGAVGTGVQRITLASDDPAVTALGAVADAAWTTGSGSHTALLKAIAGAAIDTTTPSPVKIDQTTVGTTNAVSLAQVGATTVATGNGAVSAGVQRVAIASDNTAFSVNAVQSGSWSLAANQSVNVAQMNGVTVLMGNGASGTGAQRVTIANDSTGILAGVTTVTTVTSLSQFAGNAINLGAGTVGTGTLRTTLASNDPLVAAVGTAGTAKTYTGTFIVAATALTRPANTTAYTALDSISNNATAGSVTANSLTLSDTNDHAIDISEILLTTTDTGPGTAAIQIRCHLFNSDPTASTGVVGGDNAAWSNKKAGWVGSFSGTMRAFSDGSSGVLIADEGTLRLTSPTSGAKTLYWQLQTLGAFTPSANSTTFTPTFKGFQARPA